MDILSLMRKYLENYSSQARSAWDKGVRIYTFELLDELEERVEGGYIQNPELLDWEKIHAALLNNADNWLHYSETTGPLYFDEDIAKRLCTPSQLRDMKKPCKHAKNWLEVQAYALKVAATRIQWAASYARIKIN